tara:strand:+ start:480 stop:701 length:222 start_codon:yes stop_codon:yes gene_type:complete
MKSQSDSFGNLTDFSVGDLVFWKNKGKKESGLVAKLFFSTEGGRKVAKASIFHMKTEKYLILPTIILNFEQKR